MKREYRIVNYVNGKYGYKHFYQFQEWNTVYESWDSYKDALDIQFIYDYCLLHHIDYTDIPIVEL